MAAMSDRTEAVATPPKPSLKRPRTTSSTPDCTQAHCRTLDNLPLEILLEIVSRLDCRSLRSLFLTSRRCRDAVSSHLAQLRVLHIRDSDIEGVVKTSADLAVMLVQMKSLRALFLESWFDSKDVLEALVACSWSWPFLYRLVLELDEYPADLLERLCAGCESLTEVKLGEAANDQAVEAVLTGRPDLLVLDVCTDDPESRRNLVGDCFALLPTKLRSLAVECAHLRSSAVRELARCGELRSLKLDQVKELLPEDLATGLAGCVRLERLHLMFRYESVSDCLPPAGMPALRRLELLYCDLLDSDLQQLVLRLPNLQSVCLKYCDGSTQHGLAQLGKLPALSSLNLYQTEGVSDWALAHLSTTRLTELRLGDEIGLSLGAPSTASVTAEGLLRLSQTCRFLRRIMLTRDDMVIACAKCGPGTDEGRLLFWLRRNGLR